MLAYNFLHLFTKVIDSLFLLYLMKYFVFVLLTKKLIPFNVKNAIQIRINLLSYFFNFLALKPLVELNLFVFRMLVFIF